MKRRGPFPDKGKPTVRWGRKALDQVMCLIAGLPKEGRLTTPREHRGLRPETPGGHYVLRKSLACQWSRSGLVCRLRAHCALLSCAGLIERRSSNINVGSQH